MIVAREISTETDRLDSIKTSVLAIVLLEVVEVPEGAVAHEATIERWAEACNTSYREVSIVTSHPNGTCYRCRVDGKTI